MTNETEENGTNQNKVKQNKPKKEKVSIKDLCIKFLLFVGVFVGTFGGLWFINKYKKIAHCHILTPLEEEIHLWPEWKDFFYKYKNKFNVVYRNVSEFCFSCLLILF